jgi:2-oxo-4-hydroxy-4-carboxy-5-ureidoimidazoline decarboxylase
MWRQLDGAADADARALLLAACGSSRWIERMLARRPFGSRQALLDAARAEWTALGPDDWREAFRHHPEIGDVTALRERFPATHQHSAREQSGVQAATEDVLRRLADGNRRYRERFGYTFIVCATGKSAEEMLRLLEARLEHDAAVEIRVAAEEQARITALRLAREDGPG